MLSCLFTHMNVSPSKVLRASWAICHRKRGGNKTDLPFTFWYICSSVSKIRSFLFQYAVTSFWIIFISSERIWTFFHIKFNPKSYDICINIFIFQFILRAILPSSITWSQIFNLYPRNRNIICRLNRGQHFTWTAQTNGISHTSYIYRSEMTGSGKHVFHVAQ